MKIMNLFLILVFLQLFSCASKTKKRELDIELPSEKDRSSLEYNVQANDIHGGKYQKLKVLLAPVRDIRSLKYHNDSDQYFANDISKSVEKMIFLDLNSSHFFAEVKSFKEEIPIDWNYAQLAEITKRNKVDAILLIDLTSFRIFRDPVVEIDERRNYFNIVHQAGIIGQLIATTQRQVLWSGRVNDTGLKFSAEGDLTQEQVAILAQTSLKELIKRMKQSINGAGAKWSR